MRVFRSEEAEGFEPDGHFGGLTVKEAIAEADTGSFWAAVSVVPPGGGGEAHSHPDLNQMFVVIKGEYTFNDGEQEFKLGPMDAVLFQPNELHGTRNDTDSEAHVLVVTAKA